MEGSNPVESKEGGDNTQSADAITEEPLDGFERDLICDFLTLSGNIILDDKSIHLSVLIRTTICYEVLHYIHCKRLNPISGGCRK